MQCWANIHCWWHGTAVYNNYWAPHLELVTLNTIFSVAVGSPRALPLLTLDLLNWLSQLNHFQSSASRSYGTNLCYCCAFRCWDVLLFNWKRAEAIDACWAAAFESSSFHIDLQIGSVACTQSGPPADRPDHVSRTNSSGWSSIGLVFSG